MGVSKLQTSRALSFVFIPLIWAVWNYISNMASVEKHVVTLTFPNLGKMMLQPTVRPAVWLSLRPILEVTSPEMINTVFFQCGISKNKGSCS